MPITTKGGIIVVPMTLVTMRIILMALGGTRNGEEEGIIITTADYSCYHSKNSNNNTGNNDGTDHHNAKNVDSTNSPKEDA